MIIDVHITVNYINTIACLKMVPFNAGFFTDSLGTFYSFFSAQLNEVIFNMAT